MKTTIITRNIYCLNKYIDKYLEENRLFDFEGLTKQDFIDLFSSKKLDLKPRSVDTLLLLSEDEDFFKKSDEPKIKEVNNWLGEAIYYSNMDLDLKEYIKKHFNIREPKEITQDHIETMVEDRILFKMDKANHIIVNNFNKKWDI